VLYFVNKVLFLNNFSFCFVFCKVQAFELRASPLFYSTSPFFCWVFLRLGLAFCLGWLLNMILLISAS
jgi:hypothetical protein